MKDGSRKKAIGVAAVVLALVVGVQIWLHHHQRACDARGLRYVFGQGCQAPIPPILIEKGLKRT